MNIINEDYSNDNYYILLGVDINATPETIKKAYRKLSFELHPDKNRGDINKSEKYKKITSAYNVLSNPVEKAKYDATLQSNNFNMGDDLFMNMIFPKQDINLNNINSINSINSILSNLKNRCNSNGNGNGNVNSNIFNNKNNIQGDLLSKLGISNFLNSLDLESLSSINSFGIENTNRAFNKNKVTTIQKTINISLYDAFKGCKIPLSIERSINERDIEIIQQETIYLDIPKGIDNNEIITIIGKGNRHNMTRGDIEVKININNESIFERNGIDLIYKKTITLKESLCGFSFILKYLDGREFRINNEVGNIIPPGFRKTLSNFGIERDNYRGDLIIIFDIEFPKTLTTEQLSSITSIL